jgi:hypothetical protein
MSQEKKFNIGQNVSEQTKITSHTPKNYKRKKKSVKPSTFTTPPFRPIFNTHKLAYK